MVHEIIFLNIVIIVGIEGAAVPTNGKRDIWDIWDKVVGIVIIVGMVIIEEKVFVVGDN